MKVFKKKSVAQPVEVLDKYRFGTLDSSDEIGMDQGVIKIGVSSMAFVFVMIIIATLVAVVIL